MTDKLESMRVTFDALNPISNIHNIIIIFFIVSKNLFFRMDFELVKIDHAFRRHYDAYKQEMQHAEDVYAWNIYHTTTLLVEWYFYRYPFKQDVKKPLQKCIKEQLWNILFVRRDLQSAPLKELETDKCLDWFAEPYFGPRKLKLSKLLTECMNAYDGNPYSEDCSHLFDMSFAKVRKEQSVENEYKRPRVGDDSPF